MQSNLAQAMDRKKVRRAMLLGGAVLAVLGAAALVTLSLPGHDAGAVGDPRQVAPLVRVAAAEAEARVAENEATYSTLAADADGTVVEAMGEPGQVVAAGQVVVRLAHAGPREAVVFLPEAVRPEIGSLAEASVYGDGQRRWTARLRQLSDAADPQTRTFEARYVLDGEAAAAPLGATVTVRLASTATEPDVQVPLGAVLDDGQKTGVWVLDNATSTVRFRPVKILRVSSETAVVSGLSSGDRVVSLGAHLLQEGAHVKNASESRG